MLHAQDILRVLFGKDVKDVDTEMVVKKRSEYMADRGKKVSLGGDDMYMYAVEPLLKGPLELRTPLNTTHLPTPSRVHCIHFNL